MYKDCSQAAETAKTLLELTTGVKDVDIMIAPSFASLYLIGNILKNSVIKLGAQNICHRKEGAFTGEISASMLLSCGCSYVIVGHSERREIFKETDDNINKKINAVINAGLIPILCVGETESQRDAGDTFKILDKQIESGLKDFFADNLKNLIIAYEPVWAIGTGKTATDEQAQESHKFIREKIEKRFGKSLAESIRILYGGSVKPANIKQIMNMPDIDGALVGGASLDAKTFSEVIKYK
jgi:triosephosphate isomerase